MRSDWVLAFSIVLASMLAGASRGTPTPGPPDAATTARFEQLAAAWSAHVERIGYRSDKRVYLDHPAYDGLVAMGVPILPLVMERYRRDEFWGWGLLLQHITGVPMTDDAQSFSPPVVRARWLKWWERAEGGTLLSAAQAMLQPGECCVLIALASSKTLFEWPDWVEHEIRGTMIRPAMKLLARDAADAANLSRASTSRDAFDALGMGLLHLEENTVEWPLDDGSLVRTRLGARLDEPVRSLERIRTADR